MKNSAKWCKLYCSESKYNLTFTSSKIANKVPYYLTVLILLLFLILLSTLSPSHNKIYLLVIALMLALPCYQLIRYFFKRQIHSNLLINKRALLSRDGELSLAVDEHWQITTASFILPFACSLVLDKERQTKSAWIFKDSLSNSSYRRLCRAIIRQKAIF